MMGIMNFSNIIVFNNEGQQFGSDRRYLAQLNFRSDKLRYGCDGMPNGTEATVPTQTFESIANLLLDAMNGEIQEQANTLCEFSDDNAYRAWMENACFSDRDVSWSIVCQTRNGGKKVVYLCTDGSPAPSVLDELEKLIRAALDVKEARV